MSQLVDLVSKSPINGAPGIGHTRWATHGAPNARNAHPHLGQTKRVVVVQNGIVENFLELKDELAAEGVEFQSDTDTETIVHLVEHYLATGLGLVDAARKTFKQIQGANVVVLMSADEPDKIVTARIGNAGGVVLGLGEGENFVASDTPAIMEHTRSVIFLESRQMAVVTRDTVSIETLEGAKVKPQVHRISWDPVAAEKGEYRHFMQKEIHEQVRSLTDTLAGRVDFAQGRIRLPDLNLTEELARKIDRIYITACGTAAYAGMVGKYLIEKIARIPVEVVIGSEFRYSDPILDDRTVVLAISQSGETADTLAAMEEGRRKGAPVWSIVNAIGSQAIRVADGFISMQTGPEIGVASTKAFTAPLVDQYMLAILLADLRGTIDDKTRRSLVSDLRLIPDLVSRTLDRESDVEAVAHVLKDIRDCLYLGRGINMPIAYEGALKLKGDLLHPCRSLSRRGDEARTHRPDRRAHAGPVHRPPGSLAREDDFPDPAGQGARRHPDLRGHRWRRAGAVDVRPRVVGPQNPLDAVAGHHRIAAADAGLSYRHPARPGRGPAEKFGKKCNGRIATSVKQPLATGQKWVDPFLPGAF